MMKKKSIIIVVIVAILLVGALAWGIISGKLTVSWNGFGATSRSYVCNAGLIDEYNKATNYEYRNGIESPLSIDNDGLKDIAGRVKETDKYDADPTCHAMLFWAAIYAEDIEAAQNSLTRIKSLHEKNAFPDNNLRTTSPLFEYETAIESIKPRQGGATQ